jgi:hypothetical protein
LEGFERSQNGLFGVRTKVINGVVWVNLSMEETDEDDGKVEEGIGMNVRMVEDIGIKIGKSSWIGGGVMEGGFNWKMACECLHLAVYQLLGLRALIMFMNSTHKAPHKRPGDRAYIGISLALPFINLCHPTVLSFAGRTNALIDLPLPKHVSFQYPRLRMLNFVEHSPPI